MDWDKNTNNWFTSFGKFCASSLIYDSTFILLILLNLFYHFPLFRATFEWITNSQWTECLLKIRSNISLWSATNCMITKQRSDKRKLCTRNNKTTQTNKSKQIFTLKHLSTVQSNSRTRSPLLPLTHTQTHEQFCDSSACCLELCLIRNFTWNFYDFENTNQTKNSEA